MCKNEQTARGYGIRQQDSAVLLSAVFLMMRKQDLYLSRDIRIRQRRLNIRK